MGLFPFQMAMNMAYKWGVTNYLLTGVILQVWSINEAGKYFKPSLKLFSSFFSPDNGGFAPGKGDEPNLEFPSFLGAMLHGYSTNPP